MAADISISSTRCVNMLRFFYDWLQSLGPGAQDVALLLMSPMLGVIGSVVRVMTIRYTLESVPDKPISASAFKFGYFCERFFWYWAWVWAGFASGLLVSLLFIGTLSSGAASVARVGAMALITGFAAPSVWKKQIDLAEDIIGKRLKALGEREFNGLLEVLAPDRSRVSRMRNSRAYCQP